MHIDILNKILFIGILIVIYHLKRQIVREDPYCDSQFLFGVR